MEFQNSHKLLRCIEQLLLAKLCFKTLIEERALNKSKGGLNIYHINVTNKSISNVYSCICLYQKYSTNFKAYHTVKIRHDEKLPRKI